MNRDNLFWGILLVLAGVLLMGNNFGLFNFDIWGVIWPIALILIGVFIIWGHTSDGQGGSGPESLTLLLDDATEGNVRIRYGVGELNVNDAASDGTFLDGHFGGGVHLQQERKAAAMHVDLSRPFPSIPAPWRWSEADWRWQVGLSPVIPLAIQVETGASEANLNLANLNVTDLRISTGASETNVTLPAAASFTKAHIKSGAAEVNITVPLMVAARIQTQSGLSSVNVDSSRFPRTGDYYQSPDYETAEHKVDLRVEIGVGEVNIR